MLSVGMRAGKVGKRKTMEEDEDEKQEREHFCLLLFYGSQ